MPRKYLIVLFFMAFVGARHAVPLQVLSLLSGTAFAATQENGQPCPPECVTDSLEIITYYPSPYGYYEELRGDKIIVGDSDNSYINETDLPPSGTITFEPLADDPDSSDGSLYEGSLYYQGAIGGTEGKFRFYDGFKWQDLGGGGGGYWKPSDIDSANIYYDTGNVGIGVGANEAIGARLQINSQGGKGLIITSPTDDNCNGAVCTYNYTGNMQSLIVPQGVTSLTITVYGAQGGIGCHGGSGGLGGRSRATILVSSNDRLYIFVGGQGINCNGNINGVMNGGYNGGGDSGAGSYEGGGSGGGASDVRLGGTAISHRVIVAGGGGGSGGKGGAGGNGGGVNGDNGGDGLVTNNGGKGGTDISGGAKGIDGGGEGVAGIGGNGGSASQYGGGGGGGGWYGGGGGGGTGGGLAGAAGGGGGGSGYVSGTNTSMTSGVNPGNGKVIIELSYFSTGNLIEWQDANGNVMGAFSAGGRFGIGTATPSAALDIAASKTTLADAWSTRSSLRFKENLYPIDNALNKLSSLQGVYFDYKDSHKHSLGLVAEDVGKVFPELVTYETNGQDAISLDYDKLGAVTIEAIKEQQKEIETQREEITQLRSLLKETSHRQQKEIELLKAEKKQEAVYP